MAISGHRRTSIDPIFISYYVLPHSMFAESRANTNLLHFHAKNAAQQGQKYFHVTQNNV
jgi:hypothetical protein